MGTPVTVLGNSFTVPGYNDTGWAQGSGNLPSLLIALANANFVTNNTFIGLGRNRIINGGMRVSQRFGTAAATLNDPSSIYTLDQWKAASVVSAGVYTIQQSTTVPAGYDNSLLVTVTTAEASPTGVYRVFTPIEGNVISDFQLGASTAKTLTLSFWVRSSVTGTFGGHFKNAANDRTYIFSYIVNSANTFEFKTVTFVGDLTGTWTTDTTRGLLIGWSLGTTAITQGTANAWTASNFFGVTGQTNLISTNGATWYLAGVQLEIGTTNTIFEHPSFAQELFWCQRYAEKSYDVGVAIGTSTTTGQELVTAVQQDTTTVLSGRITYKVPKRITPTTLTLYKNDGTSGSWEWLTTAGSATARTTTASTSDARGFNVTQTAALEYLGKGQWFSSAGL